MLHCEGDFLSGHGFLFLYYSFGILVPKLDVLKICV